MVDAAVDLIADGIENPHNVRALVAAARMFDAVCRFRRPKTNAVTDDMLIQHVDEYELIVALENVPNALSVYDFRLPRNVHRVALVVGNERFGIRPELLARCQRHVQIPMGRGKIDTLNVAAAAAVGLHYLREPPAKTRFRAQSQRPQVLFESPRNAAEFGSSLRSASAFGWREVFLKDTHHIWFHANRKDRAEARAAARKMKNDVRILPFEQLDHLREVITIDERSNDEHLRLRATIMLAEIARRLRK